MKLARKIQKIFANLAVTGDLAIFGSLKSGSPAFSRDPDVLQSDAFEEGFTGSDVGNESPVKEDVNSALYVATYNISYLMERGIAEWSAAQTYYKGALILRVTDTGKAVIYYSLADNNLNHSLDDTAYWKPYRISGGTNIPLLAHKEFTFILQGDEAIGWAMQGSTISKTVQPDTYAYLVNEYNTATDKSELINGVSYAYKEALGSKRRFYSSAVYAALFSAIGDTGNGFILNTTAETFTLPKTVNFLRPAMDNISLYKNDQIVNITGKIDASAAGSKEEVFGETHQSKVDITGAFQGIFETQEALSDAGLAASMLVGFNFDASRVVNTGDQVQPRSRNVYLYYRVGPTIDSETTGGSNDHNLLSSSSRALPDQHPAGAITGTLAGNATLVDDINYLKDNAGLPDAPSDGETYGRKDGLWSKITAFINGISLLGKDNTCEDLGLQCAIKEGNNITKTQISESAVRLLLKFTTADGFQDISASPLTFSFSGSAVYGDPLFANSTNQSLIFQGYDTFRATFASGQSKLNAIKTISFRCSRTDNQYTRGIIFSNSNGVDKIYTTGFTWGTGTIGGEWGASLPYDGTPYDLAFSKQEGTELWVIKDGVKIAIITVASDFVFDLTSIAYMCVHDNISAGLESVSGILCSTESIGEYTPSEDYPTASSVTKDVIACKNYFGEIYTADNTTAQTIPTGATYTKATAFNTAGEYRGITLDAANNKMTLTSAGYYKIGITASSKLGTAGITLKTALFLGGVKVPSCQSVRKINNANDESTVSFGGIIKVDTANSDIDVRVSHDNGGDVSLTTVFCNLNAVYIGDLTL